MEKHLSKKTAIAIVIFIFSVLVTYCIYFFFSPLWISNIALSLIIGTIPFSVVLIELIYFFYFSHGKSEYLESEWKGKKWKQFDKHESYKPNTQELKMKRIYEEKVGAIATRQRKWTMAGVPGVCVTYPDTKIIFYKTFLFLKFDLRFPLIRLAQERYLILKLRYKDIQYIKNTHSNIGYFSGLEIKHSNSKVPRYIFINTPHGGCNGLYSRVIQIIKTNDIKLKMKDR